MLLLLPLMFSKNSGPRHRVLVLVRHGERLDVADRTAWHAIRTRENEKDLPHTDEGKRQARQARAFLKQFMRSGAGDDTSQPLACISLHCINK